MSGPSSNAPPKIVRSAPASREAGENNFAVQKPHEVRHPTPALMQSLTLRPANDAAETARGDAPHVRDGSAEMPIATPDAAPLSSPTRIVAAPPRNRIESVAVFVRRTVQLSMDALILIVFSPVITGWWMVERRRRRTPGA